MRSDVEKILYCTQCTVHCTSTCTRPIQHEIIRCAHENRIGKNRRRRRRRRRSSTDLKDEEFGDAFGEPTLRTLQDHLEHVSTQFLHHHEYLRARQQSNRILFKPILSDSNPKRIHIAAAKLVLVLVAVTRRVGRVHYRTILECTCRIGSGRINTRT